MVQSFAATFLLAAVVAAHGHSLDSPVAVQNHQNKNGDRPQQQQRRPADDASSYPNDEDGTTTIDRIRHDQHGRSALGISYNYNPCPQVPTLHCRNDSQCRPGSATFDGKHSHLNLQTQESGYYCDCPSERFVGHECEVELEDCRPDDPDDPVHSCYYGSECKASKNGFVCDCTEANNEQRTGANGGGGSAKHYAGSMCQHESTSMCAVSLAGTHAPNHQFCTNHGECFKMVSGGEPHPGCLCKPGWTGDHCELRGDPFVASRSQDQTEGEGEGKPNTVLWSLAIIPMVLGGLVACRVDRVLKAQRAREEEERRFLKDATDSNMDVDPDGSGTLGSEAASAAGEDGPLGTPTDDSDDGDLSEEVEDYTPATTIV